jgi:hypothetical protein
MSTTDIKISIQRALEQMFYDSKDGEIPTLRHYEQEFGVPYSYLRKVELSKIIVATTNSKKHRRYKWNEVPNPTKDTFRMLAERAFNYSPSSDNQPSVESGVPIVGFVRGSKEGYSPMQILFNSDQIVDLTVILNKYGLPPENVKDAVTDILKLNLHKSSS